MRQGEREEAYTVISPSVRHRSGYRGNIPYTPGRSTTETVFTIRLYNISGLKGKASVLSTRGGVLKGKEFVVR
jgi:hypothetical protein